MASRHEVEQMKVGRRGGTEGAGQKHDGDSSVTSDNCLWTMMVMMRCIRQLSVDGECPSHLPSRPCVRASTPRAS